MECPYYNTICHKKEGGLHCAICRCELDAVLAQREQKEIKPDETAFQVKSVESVINK